MLHSLSLQTTQHKDSHIQVDPAETESINCNRRLFVMTTSPAFLISPARQAGHLVYRVSIVPSTEKIKPK